MAFDNAKRILTNEDARVASSAEGIYDDDLVILFWENVEAHHIDECVRYLNSTGQRVVSSGTTFYDVTFDDALHHLHAYYQETDQRIYRVLMRSSITTSSITQSDTKWRLQSGETYEAGTSNLVLAMYNVDPNSIVSLETESLNETYTSIYLLGGTELTGTWFNVARESEYNSQTGLYDLRWYISRYQTKEYIFANKENESANVVDFFKHHMTASAIDDFESNYYFDSATLGDYYYSTDGTNYTKKNDTAATGTLPATAKNIITDVSGRVVSYEQRPDRENGEVDIFLTLTFAKSQTALNKTISGKDPHLFFNGYNSYLEFANTDYQKAQKAGTFFIDFEFPEGYTPLNINDDLDSDEEYFFRGNESDRIWLFSCLSAQAFDTDPASSYNDTRTGMWAYLRTGKDIPAESKYQADDIYLVIGFRFGDYPSSEFSRVVEWNHGQRRIRVAVSADVLGADVFEFGNNPILAIENTPAATTDENGDPVSPVAAYGTSSVIYTLDPKGSGNAGNNSGSVARNHSLFPYRIGTGYLSGDGEFSGASDAEKLRLRNEKFLLYSFHYYNCLVNEKHIKDWCDNKKLPSMQPTLTIDPSLGSNIIDSKIKDIALKEEQRLQNSITQGKAYRIENLGTLETDSGYDNAKWEYYPLAPQLIIPTLNDSSTTADESLSGSRTRHIISSASRSGDTISITLSTAHGKTGTWVSTGLYDKIIVTGLSKNSSVDNADHVNPNANWDSSTGENVTITFTGTNTLTIQDTDISQSGNETYELEVLRDPTPLGSWFKAGATRSIGTARVAEINIPGHTYHHDATVIGDVFVSGGSREETVEVNTSNTEQKFITDGGTVADPKSGEEKSIVNEVLPNGKYRTTITTRKSKLQSAVSEVSSDSESSTTTINLRNVKQETAEASVPGKIVTVENTPNEDGTFRTSKTITTAKSQTATSGSTNALRSETVVINNNASSALGAPADQNDGTILIHESEELSNGLFRNITRTITSRTDVANVTDESTTGNDDGAGFTETTVKKYNQASAETVGAGEDAAGTTVIVENTINEDGTFNTIKRTRVEREAQAASGTKGILSSEAVVITNNAASALAQASSTTAGTTKIHESQQLENGLFRNIQRTITSHANDGSTDKVDQTGSSETILRKYNQAIALTHDASEEANGTTITIENTINADGTFNTVKRTRVDSELSATGGSANAFRNEVVSITINANAQLGQPSDPSDGVSTIHESEQLPNGLFKNTVRTITARTDVATVTDEKSSGADDGAGFTEVITKKYNQSTAESVGENDDGAGKTVTVENTINEDGTFNTVKSIKTDRESTAAGGSTNAFRSESVVITNNASSQLTAPTDQNDGTILIHESEQLPNGLFRNIVRTITARTDVANVEDTIISGDDGGSGYTEVITKKYNQANAETVNSEDAAGKTIVIENTINEDGKYNTIKRVRTDRSTAATAVSKSAGESTTVVITNNDDAAAVPSDPAAGTTVITESIPLENGKFRNVVTTTTAANITGSSSTQIGADGLTESVEVNTSNAEQKFVADSGNIADATDGKIKTIDNQPLPDGKFRTVVTTRNIADKEYGILTQASQEVQSLQLTFKDVTETRKDQILQRIKVDEAGNWWEVSTDGGSTVFKKNGAFNNDTLPSDAKLISESALYHGREVQSSLSCNEQTNLWTVQLVVNFYEANTTYSTTNPFEFKIDSNTSMKIYMAFNLTTQALDTWESYFNGATSAGTTRQMGTPVKNEHGRWDVQAVELIKTGISTTFTIGKTKYFYGFHHPKKPKTTGSDTTTEININGSGSSLPSTAVLSGNTKEEEDGTFSWLFSYDPQVEVEYGATEATASADSLGSGALIEYGDSREKVIWKGRYSERDLTSGGVNLVGQYTSVNVGYHGGGSTYAITGCQIEQNLIKNEKIDNNGKVSYDVYRQITTAEINGDDDDWYLVSSTESFDKNKSTITTLTTTGNVAYSNNYHTYSTFGTVGGASGTYAIGQSAPSGAGTEDEEADTTKTLISGASVDSDTDKSIPTYHLIEAVTKRRKTISVFRKYFSRRPTTADLQARAFNKPTSSGNHKSIYTVMQATSDEETESDAKLVRSFQVVSIGRNVFAVELREVRQSVIHSYDMDAITKIVSQETLDTSTISITNTGTVTTDPTMVQFTVASGHGIVRGDIIQVSGHNSTAVTTDGVDAPINGDHIVEDVTATAVFVRVPRITGTGTVTDNGNIKKYKARLCTGYSEIVGGHFRASAGKLEEDLNSTDTFKDKVNGEMY